MTRREKVILEGEDRTSPALAKAESGFKRFDDSVKKAATVGGLFFLGQALLKIGVASVKAAVDAEEAAAAFDTTFGTAAGRAGAFVEEFANRAGFANYQLEQMMAVTGNVIQGIGGTEDASAALSESMVRLAADVASFSNAQGGAQAVMLALQSALNGEREALKTYGLAVSEAEVVEKALSMTHKESADQLTRLDKALATLEVATEKAGKAIGDLDRTSDSNANTMRRVAAVWEESKVTLGESLLPVLDQLLPLLETLAPVVGQSLAPAFQALGVAAAILAPPLKLVAAVLDALPGAAILAVAGIVGLAVHFKTFTNLLDTVRLRGMYAVDAVKALSPAMMGAAAAVAVATAAFTFYTNRAKEAQQAADNYRLTLDQQTGAATENTTALIANSLQSAGLLDDLNALGVTAADLAAAWGGNEEAMARVEEATSGAGDGFGDLGWAISYLGGRAAKAQADLASFNANMEASGSATANASAAYTRAVPPAQNLGNALNAAYLSGKAFGEALRVSNEQAALAKERQDAAAEATRNLTAAMLANSDPVYRAADAAQRQEEAIIARDKVLADPEHTAEDAARAQMDVARATLEAQAAADALDPRTLQLAMVAIADATDQPIDKVKELLRLLGVLDTWGGVRDYYHPGSTRPGGDIPFLASGGEVTRTGLAVIHKGESVVPAQASPLTGPSSPPTTVNATIQVTVAPSWPVSAADARKVARDIQKALDDLTVGEVHQWQR